MSTVSNLIEQIIHYQPESSGQLSLQAILNKIKSFKMQQLQQFIRQISHIVDQRSENSQNQLLILKLIKQMLVSGSYSVYLFSNVYIFPWVASLCSFNKSQPLDNRAFLLYKDITGKTASNNNVNIQSFKMLLAYAEQFLVFFGQNLRFYPYSKYKIKNAFAKQLQSDVYTRSLSQFTNFDLSSLQSNLKKRGSTFRDELSDFTDFLNFKIEECILDPSKFHDNLYLLISLVQISESFCISIIAFRLCSFLMPEKIQITCKMINFIMSTAEIEAVEAINIRCLPLVLQYLLPVDFKQNMVRDQPKIILQGVTLHKLIDYYYVWYEKTKILKLSTKIYEYSLGLVEYLKKPFKLSYQTQIREFIANLQKIQQNNEVKRAFIIDQHQQEQQQLVKLLKDVAFCVNSQKVQRKVAYSNVLDDLTITQKDSISQFSQSLLQSAKKRERGEITSNKSQKSFSSKLKNSSKIISRRNKQAAQENQQVQNIYYYKNGLPLSSNEKKNIRQAIILSQERNGHLQSFQNKKIQSYENYYSKQCQSYADVQYPSFPKVTSKDSRKDSRGRPALSSSKSDISLHSSQFSQKDNNQQHRFNRQIQSIYTQRSNKNDGKEPDNSGQFLYFEKQSQLKSQKSIEKVQKDSFSKSQIQFVDSLGNINQSQSCQILEFGMDINAKIPQTISKPKFNFRNNTDAQMILKNLQNSTPQNKASIKAHPQRQESSPKKVEGESRTGTNQQKQSYFETKNSFKPRISKIKSIDSGYILSPKEVISENKYGNSQSSGSMIKEDPAQRHLISQSISLSDEKVPSNFKEVFPQKSEKASVLSSSRSLKRLRQLPNKQVEIPDFKKLRNLQNELGKLKKQTQKYNKQLEEKNEQMERLKKERKQMVESDPYFLKKQNEIMKILLKNKEKAHPTKNAHSSGKNLTKLLKQSSIKNYNMSLKDYNSQVLKLKFSNIKGFTKEQKKSIVSNRCILLKNDLIEIGYSFKNKEVTLYLTLKNYCDSLQINLLENSINFSQSIRRSFDKLYVGKQMKFKTEVNQTKQNNVFIPAAVVVKLTYQYKLDQKNQEFQCQLPLTPYNMADPLSQTEGASLLSQSKNETTAYITPLYNSSEDLIKKGKSYLINIFPHGYFNQDGSIFTLNYKWKDRIQVINIKLKQRAFRIEGTGYPMESGRELIQTIINMLID